MALFLLVGWLVFFISKSASLKNFPVCGSFKHISHRGETMELESLYCLHEPHIVGLVFNLQIFPFPALEKWGSKPSNCLVHKTIGLKASFENISWFAVHLKCEFSSTKTNGMTEFSRKNWAWRSQHGKDSESLEKSGEVSVFLLLTIREWASFEPFGSDNWTWTSLQGLKAAL